MRSEWIRKAAAALLAALLLELIPCQFSFWTTVTKKTEDLTARAEILAGYTAIEELDQDVANDAAAADSGEDVADSATTAAGDQTTEGGSALYLLDGSYLDDAGYLHVPDGSLTLRVKNYKGSLQRIFLNLDFLYNQPVLAELLEEIRRTFPDKSIWCYSGYLFDKDMVPGGKVYTPFTDRMLSCIDVLVDGEFIQELKNLSLQFRGSSNQRILHLKDGKLIKEGL